MLIKSSFTEIKIYIIIVARAELVTEMPVREDTFISRLISPETNRLLSLVFLIFHRAIVALVYNVLKAFMEMNSTMFDELTATYKSDRQR